MRFAFRSCFLAVLFYCTISHGEEPKNAGWTQWRGPTRDGQFTGQKWPDRLNKTNFSQVSRKPLGPSYSGPVVSKDLVYTTETRDKKYEAAIAFDRKTGTEIWRTEWEGAMTVPFFAAANGSWIRSTPTFNEGHLYVAGMRDVLMCLDGKTGDEIWKVDFVKEYKTPLPSFGFVCSPLVTDDAVYVQAGASCFKLDKKTGKGIWRSLKDGGGMFNSAFSSPIIAEVSDQKQLVVQTRQNLTGVSLESGKVLWKQAVPAFRGMNILTPIIYNDAIFTSSYRNGSWLYNINRTENDWKVNEAWKSNAQGYMSTPVVINDHVYLHLQNERFACINLKNGERTWTSQPVGKYASLIAQGNRILALMSNGKLLLLEADPAKFTLIDELEISDDETWAHLAMDGNQVFIRELNALAVYEWK